MPRAPRPEEVGPAADRSWGLLVGVLTITALAFSRVLGFEFTNWDDPQYVTENAAIRTLDLTAIRQFFTTPYVASYVPLTMLSYAVEFALFGLAPAAFHATNLLLHLISTALVFGFARQLGATARAAALAAALFGVHPLHVESVAWVAERKDVLSGAFFAATLFAWARYVRSRGELAYGLAIACCLLSLLAKGMGVTLPLLLALTAWWQRGRGTDGAPALAWRVLALRLLPFVGLAVTFAALAFHFQSISGTIAMGSGYEAWHAPFLASRGLLFYLGATIAPLQLSAYYPYPALADGSLPWDFLAAPILVVALGVALWIARGRRWILFGAAFFLVAILPVLQWIPIGHAAYADRYHYLPSIGLFLGVALGVGKRLDAGHRAARWAAPFSLALVALFATSTFARSAVWHDSVTLWSDVIDKQPSSALAYNSRGNAWSVRGNARAALADFTRAIELDPRRSETFNNRGLERAGLGDHEGAVADYARAIELEPTLPAPYLNRGLAAMRMGRAEAARSDFDQAIALAPRNPDAWFNRGLLRAQEGDLAGAIADFDQVLRLSPNDRDAHERRARLATQRRAVTGPAR